MTPEEEWVASSLRRDRERRMWDAILRPTRHVRQRESTSHATEWIIVAAIVTLVLVGVFAR